MSAAPAVALTIAGTDSGGGAGVAADLRTFAAHGVHGALAVTTVTAQDTVGVQAAHVLPAAMVAAQIDAVVTDLRPKVAKTGMLGSPDIVEVVLAKAQAGKLPPLVVDPVLVNSAGEQLFTGTAVEEAYRQLLARAVVATPNMPEAALLTGRDVDRVEAMEAAARRLHELGPEVVVVTGGHLGDSDADDAVDVVFDGRAVTLLRQPWLQTTNVHGSGCTLSAAIAAKLALGLDPLAAIVAAKEYVHRAIAGAARWKLGAGHGPLDQLGASSPGSAGEQEWPEAASPNSS